MEVLELVDQPVRCLTVSAMRLRVRREVAVTNDRSIERHRDIVIERGEKIPLLVLDS
jgi:hypothetical protein